MVQAGAFGERAAGRGDPARDPADLCDGEKTCGSPRIHAALRDEGERVSRKRVARLMREMGIEAVTRRRFKGSTTKREAGAKPAPDLVNRDFSADRPDRLRVADITYVPTSAGWLYLAVALDVCRQLTSYASKIPGAAIPADPASSHRRLKHMIPRPRNPAG